MEVDALKKGKCKNKGKGKGKGKGKDNGKEKSKGKSEDKPEEGTTDTSNVKCFFCKEKGHTRKDCPEFSAWLAEKKTVGHQQSASSIEEDGWIFALNQEHEELCELIIIDSGASVHVCPPDHGQENGLRKSSKTKPLLTASRAEMKQHGMRQVSYDTEVGKITTDYRSVGRETANLVVGIHDGFKLRCALHEESLLDIQRRRERTRHDPQRRSVLRGSQTFKIVVEGSKHAGTQSYDSSRS